MSNYGITATGFSRKRLDTLLNELNAEVKTIFGESFDTSPQSADGQINGVISESNANLWEIAEASYNAFNPNAATDEALSKLVMLNGIQRLGKSKTRVQLLMNGTFGTQIPAGTLCSIPNTSTKFETESDMTILSNSGTLVWAIALDYGPIPAVAGTITGIDTPINNWSSVTNPSDGVIGRDEETDGELRARRERSTGRYAQNIMDALYSELADLDGVSTVLVLNNDSDTTDSEGLPPHSFKTVVAGGDEAEIAKIIWRHTPAGILSHGDISETVVDSQGLNKTVKFSRPTYVDVYVRLWLTIDSSVYPSNGDDLIKQAIVDYAKGDYLSNRSFGLGDDVVPSRLYTPANSVAGHEIDVIYLGSVANFADPSTSEPIVIGTTEVARFSVDNIYIVGFVP